MGTTKSRRTVRMPNPVRRESRDGRMLNWYATAQDAADAELLLRETGQLDRESAAPLGRVETEDVGDLFAVAS